MRVLVGKGRISETLEVTVQSVANRDHEADTIKTAGRGTIQHFFP
jgi:hypothetical protein